MLRARMRTTSSGKWCGTGLPPKWSTVAVKTSLSQSIFCLCRKQIVFPRCAEMRSPALAGFKSCPFMGCLKAGPEFRSWGDCRKQERREEEQWGSSSMLGVREGQIPQRTLEVYRVPPRTVFQKTGGEHSSPLALVLRSRRVFQRP